MKEKDKWHASYLLRLELLRFLSFERTLELRHKMNSIANKIAIGIRNGKIKR